MSSPWYIAACLLFYFLVNFQTKSSMAGNSKQFNSKYQIQEYSNARLTTSQAIKASGSKAIAIKCSDGIVLIKKTARNLAQRSRLIIDQANQITEPWQVDSDKWVITNGIQADCRFARRCIKQLVASHFNQFKESIPIDKLADQLSGLFYSMVNDPETRALAVNSLLIDTKEKLLCSVDCCGDTLWLSAAASVDSEAFNQAISKIKYGKSLKCNTNEIVEDNLEEEMVEQSEETILLRIATEDKLLSLTRQEAIALLNARLSGDIKYDIICL